MSSQTTIIAGVEGAEETREFVVGADGPRRSLADLLAAHGLPLNTRCGQRGLCRGCEVVLREGAAAIDGAAVSSASTVRACQARVVRGGRVVLEIPARSRIEHRPQVGETFSLDIPCAHLPLFETDAGRDTVFAIDLGTTTVVALLVDIATGEVLSRAGAFNEQVGFGDNVLTRIDAARLPGKLAGMQSAAVGTLAPLLSRACERAGRTPARLAGGVVAGNTTMLHLLVGEDPTPLGIAPFVPRFIHGLRVAASAIGLAVGTGGDALAPDTPLQLLPGIAGYIGADITAGLYATGMIFDEAPGLFVDIGTNGEIVLQSGGRLTACATAAGPAFEGSGLLCGARARAGAISAIAIGLEPFHIEAATIGGASPARADGICGSAYVDFLASGRRCGLLLESGRFDPRAWDRVPEASRIEGDFGRGLRLAGASGPYISESDIAVLLQAKAAIAAGIDTLLQAADLEAGDLARVYLAGGFGMHLNVGHAIGAGLLPGFREDQVRVVGNTSLAGGLLALLDRTTLVEMETLRERVEVLELNLQEGFEDSFVDHLSLP